MDQFSGLHGFQTSLLVASCLRLFEKIENFANYSRKFRTSRQNFEAAPHIIYKTLFVTSLSTLKVEFCLQLAKMLIITKYFDLV